MSKLINKTRLERFATGLWAKIKERYDVAFKNATISPGTGNEKHITFERINGQTPLKVSLEDYARLQDRNEFKKDVSVNDAANIHNTHIGTVRFDRGLKNATCLSYNTTVNLDLRYVISRTLNKEDLLVTNDKGAPFTFSLSNNIVKLDLATRDNSSDTIFKVMYTL